MPVRIVLGILTAVAGYVLFNKKHKIFVSYYHDSDKHYKRLLEAWSANDKFSLEFEDVSTDVSINSENEKYIKRRIADKINQCDVLIVLVGKKSHQRPWITWEINKAKEYKKRIVAIKVRKNYASPRELLSSGVVWVYEFNKEKIIEAFEG